MTEVKITGLSPEAAKETMAKTVNFIGNISMNHGFEPGSVLGGLKIATELLKLHTVEQVTDMVTLMCDQYDKYGPVGLNQFLTDIPMDILAAMGKAGLTEILRGKDPKSVVDQTMDSIRTLRQLYDKKPAA